MTRVLIATLGSIGDLLPMLAIAKALNRANVDTIIAADWTHREVAERYGYVIAPLGSHQDPSNVPLKEGQDDGISFIDHVNFSQLDQLFHQILNAAAGADALLAPHFVVPAHLVAEKLAIPFIACAMNPAYLSSAHAPRTPPHWHLQLAALRRRNQLPRKPFPYTAVLTSPASMLGIFPQLLCSREDTQNRMLQVVGYPWLPAGPGNCVDEDVRVFCDSRTVLFSFGTHVDRHQARYIYEESIAACRLVELKCLYLSRFVEPPTEVGRHDPNVMLRSYLDHDAVLPHVGAIVHHAGLGTTMAAFRHAKPMALVPFRYDQPYNAQRIACLIGAPCIPIAAYSRHTLSEAMRKMLAAAPDTRRALTHIMAKEQDGARLAAGQIIRLAGQRPAHSPVGQ